MEYPLHLSFRILAFAPQIHIRDAGDRPLLYVRQKLLKIREAVQVYRDDTRTEHLFDIQADRIIDWSARYTFTLPDGTKLGSVKRSGLRSLFAAHYAVFDATDRPLFEIEQTNPWVGLLDSFVGEIPIVGLFTGYFLNPVYAIRRPGEQEPVIRLIKKRSFLESGFAIEKGAGALTPNEEGIILLSAIMVTLLERTRG